MLTFLLIIHAFLAILLILVVIIQPGQEEGGVAMMGGTATGSAFGADTGAVLTKTTAVLGALFLLNSFIISIVGSRYLGQTSVVEKVKVSKPASQSKKK
jgi:preprotein translocase subunit SecG